MPKIDYTIQNLIFKKFGENALVDFLEFSYANRYLYKQHILKECISPKQWLDLKLNKKKHIKHKKIFNKETSDFNTDEIAKELGVNKKQVWDIYNSALKKIRRIIVENPQKYDLLINYFRCYDDEIGI